MPSQPSKQLDLIGISSESTKDMKSEVMIRAMRAEPGGNKGVKLRNK